MEMKPKPDLCSMDYWWKCGAEAVMRTGGGRMCLACYERTIRIVGHANEHLERDIKAGMRVNFLPSKPLMAAQPEMLRRFP